jgi:hypothetical protein
MKGVLSLLVYNRKCNTILVARLTSAENEYNILFYSGVYPNRYVLWLIITPDTLTASVVGI